MTATTNNAFATHVGEWLKRTVWCMDCARPPSIGPANHLRDNPGHVLVDAIDLYIWHDRGDDSGDDDATRDEVRHADTEARVTEARRQATVTALEHVYSGPGLPEADALLDALDDLGWKVVPA
jgi:hypothetical protein